MKSIHTAKTALLSSCLLLSLSVTSVVYSQSAQADEVKQASSEKQAKNAIMFRQSLLQLVRSNMGPLGAMAKGNIPMDAEVIALNAQRIEFLAGMMHDYFALDTSSIKVDTGAKDNIWKNHEDFTAKTNDMVDAAAKLQALVSNNESDSFRRGIGALGASCKACHDKYKKD